MSVVPSDLADLLERVTWANLATVRRDGTPQVEPMWFTSDGTVMRFTHTDERQKYRNIAANPAVAISIQDPEQPYRYLGIRGTVIDVARDSDGSFFRTIAGRYGRDRTEPPDDAEHRVVITVSIDHASGR